MTSRREKELARMRAERQAARLRAEAAARKRRNALLAAGLAVVLLVAAVAASVVALTDDDEQVAAPQLCTWTPTEQPASRPVQPPSTDPDTTPSAATVVTDQGTLAFTLDADVAPCASASINALAAQGFYDDTPCHRLTTAGIFVLQCGDPTGTGTGGPGYQFGEEGLEGATYPRGTVAMAKGSDPGTTGSQFFLVYADSELPPDYTPVGTITEGLEVLDTVADAGATAPDPATGNTAPNLAVQIATLETTSPNALDPVDPAPVEPADPAEPVDPPVPVEPSPVPE